MKALILAGGSGTRLWPLSRKNYPKQFLRLSGNQSLLQQTVERLCGVMLPEDIIVVTNNEYKFHVKSDLDALFNTRSSPLTNIILEPESRNTAPAIVLGVKYCLEKLDCDRDEVLFISPSDHIIKPVDKFMEYIKQADEVAKQGHIITFGIKPTRPETGYGYIKIKNPPSPPFSKGGMGGFSGEITSHGYFKAERFTEKPDTDTAKQYIKEGNYYWNSGMFAFSINTIINEFEKHATGIKEMFDMSFDEAVSNFDQMPDISIDYAVMEKSDRLVMLPLDLYWNDIGSWDSLFDILDKDKNGNVKTGDVITINTRNSLIIGSKRLISTIGIKDCLIVETDDAMLITKRGHAQKVKEVINKLKSEDRKEALEHVTTYRPWGSYTVLEEGPRYKIKRVVVNVGERLSLQLHHHRSEHWVVIRGTAKVIIGDLEKLIHENESTYIPKSTIHRLENPGKVPLEIIEVQNGEYVGEDDIVRLDDHYGR
ncbi:MAG: mannose-1-phosphate guanylyltransferase/mannose-6-phosphate isomerase [Nitrospirota bacterium]